MKVQARQTAQERPAMAERWVVHKAQARAQRVFFVYRAIIIVATTRTLRINIPGRCPIRDSLNPSGPININESTRLMNDCLAGIKRRLNHRPCLEGPRSNVEAEL